MEPSLCATTFPRSWKGVRRDRQTVNTVFTSAVIDTETVEGKIFASGFFDGVSASILYGIDRDHPRWLLDQICRLPARGKTAVFAGHFVKYDLGVLLYRFINPNCKRLPKAPQRSFFSLLDPVCTIEIFWGRPTFGKIKFETGTVHLIDTYAFFGTSLAKALKAIGSKIKKLPKPPGLGKRIIPPVELRPYLDADLHGAMELLTTILGYHREYKTRLCLSSPMLAGKIFRHYYMKKDFARPSKALIAASMLSYHGGKNSFPAKTSRWYKNAWDLDINSAYAQAMHQLPNFEAGKWKRGAGLEFLKTHPHGIYKIEGFLLPCEWGCLFTHDFKRAFGPVKDLWVTGYEALEAINSKELILERVSGWGFKQNKSAPPSAFKYYVEHFFELKRTATDKGMREFYKHMLTDLYGKFIARTEDENTGELVAGSMFDPSIASLITGYVRARIHGLEHKYSALHTATDGFITQKKPKESDVGITLGSLKQENFGPVLILRNKLYLHYDESGKLIKSGLHGFELGPSELLKVWKSAKRTYRVERLVNWSQSWHIGLPPGTPQMIEKRLILN